MTANCRVSDDLTHLFDARDILRQALPCWKVWGRKDFAEAYINEETHECDRHRPEPSPGQSGK